jgi:hypothetical protein
VGLARQPHGLNNGVTVPTVFGLRPPPCPPTASLAAPARRPAHRFCRPRPPSHAAFKRSNHPPCGAPLSSSSARCHHCAIVSPPLNYRKMPPGPPPNFLSPPRAPHRRRELIGPPCQCPRLLLRNIAAVPLQPNQATVDSPLKPSSDCLDPILSTAPPSTSSPTARTLTVTPTPACRRLSTPPICFAIASLPR